MSFKRLLRGRWARILGWAAAGVTWGTTAVAVAAGAGEGTATEAVSPPIPAVPPVTIPAPVATAPLPTIPVDGLVVLRFTPVDRPEAQVITRTVTVPSSGPAATAAQPVTVTSSGS